MEQENSPYGIIQLYLAKMPHANIYIYINMIYIMNTKLTIAVGAEYS